MPWTPPPISMSNRHPACSNQGKTALECLGKILLATGGGLSRVTGRAGHQDHGNLPTEGGKMQDTESRNVIVVAKFCTANKCQQRRFEVWVSCSPRGTKSWPSPARTDCRRKSGCQRCVDIACVQLPLAMTIITMTTAGLSVLEVSSPSIGDPTYTQGPGPHLHSDCNRARQSRQEVQAMHLDVFVFTSWAGSALLPC